jgi:hypothetical protein
MMVSAGKRCMSLGMIHCLIIWRNLTVERHPVVIDRS